MLNIDVNSLTPIERAAVELIRSRTPGAPATVEEFLQEQVNGIISGMVLVFTEESRSSLIAKLMGFLHLTGDEQEEVVKGIEQLAAPRREKTAKPRQAERSGGQYR